MNFKSMNFNCKDADAFEEIDGHDQLEIPSDLPKNFVLKFVKYHLFMYDKGSPIVAKYRDLEKRQTAAFKEAGIWDDPFHKDKIDEMRSISYPGQAELIMDILTAQNSATWSALVSNEVLHRKITYDILKEQERKTQDLAKQVKLLENQAELVERINGYYKELFSSVHENEQEEIRRKIKPETVHLFKK